VSRNGLDNVAWHLFDSCRQDAITTAQKVSKIAALPPAVRKGSALPGLRFKIKLFGSAACWKAAGFPHSERRSRIGQWLAIFHTLPGIGRTLHEFNGCKRRSSLSPQKARFKM
jgi:hypothetical protein